MRIDENGVQHPEGTDKATPEGLEHIRHCEECRRRFPWVAEQLQGVPE